MSNDTDWQEKAETEKGKAMFIFWCVVKLIVWLVLVLIGSFIGSGIGYFITKAIEGGNQ